MTLVVILSVRVDKIAEFHQFERRAAELMKKYGGAIERTVVIAPRDASTLFKEVHIVTFESERDFLDYQKDDSLCELLQLREQCIVETEVLVGERGPSY